MLNTIETMKMLVQRSAMALRALLAQVPAIKLKKIELDKHDGGHEFDIVASITVAGHRRILVCEVKSSGRPRIVRMALHQLLNQVAQMGRNTTPIFIAPYLSPEAQALCQEQKVGFLDFEGNARLVFDGVFIDRQVASKPPVERRAQKSIFKPKSAQVLRVMLRNPSQAWRVAELAKAADVSLGHVSNVRAILLDREWAGINPNGLSLIRPDSLLDTWRDTYEPPAGKRLPFYTTLHGKAFEEAARKALHKTKENGVAAFASFSAAEWLAPYARSGSHFFYADDVGLSALENFLKLSSGAKGENVVITRLKDPGLLRDSVEPSAGIVCTSPVQTYLDLTLAGERGREAADHLRRVILSWRN